MTALVARSWLFTPGDRPDRFAKAARCGADVMILDWEDAVAPAAKQAARAAVLEWLHLGDDAPRAWVRINDRHSEFWEQDVDALAAAGKRGLAGVVLPKTQSDADVADTVDRLGISGLPIVALIESALGVENALSIAISPSVAALALGSADLRLDAGLSDDDRGWVYPRSRLVFASRAAGLPGPIDGPEMRLDDTDAVRNSAAAARAVGFSAKFCLHPRQVPTVNVAFGFDDDTVRWARRVVAAADTSDGAAVRVDGEMVDRPRLALAHHILNTVDTKEVS